MEIKEIETLTDIDEVERNKEINKSRTSGSIEESYESKKIDETLKRGRAAPEDQDFPGVRPGRECKRGFCRAARGALGAGRPAMAA